MCVNRIISHFQSKFVCQCVWTNLNSGFKVDDDDANDLILIQPVSKGQSSQCGMKGDHCDTQQYKTVLAQITL